MVDKEMLNILCCPETKQTVVEADSDLVEQINQNIASGGLKNRGGQAVTEKIDSGLVRSDNKYLYPVRNDIPIMLIEEGICLERLI